MRSFHGRVLRPGTDARANPTADDLRPPARIEEATMTTTFTRTRRASARAVSLADIRVADVMHRGVITCERDAPLAVVARVMAAHRIHCVVVPTGDEPGSWRIVSDLDVVEAASADDLAERTVAEMAASNVLTVSSIDTLERAAQLMHERRERHLVVLDPASRAPVGVLSTLDVADAIAEITTRRRSARNP